MSFVGNMLENADEVLFFILVFLILFSGRICDTAGSTCEFSGCEILFFIILFLLLFCNCTEREYSEPQ